MTDQRTPTRVELLNRAIENFSAGLFVCRPGQIQKVDPQTLLCDVKPLLKELHENESGDTVVEPLPVIPGCVLFLPQGGDFVDTFPVQQGDSCWLLFTDRSLDKWQAGNGDTDPVFRNRHDMSGALVLVGGRPKGKAISEYDTSRRVIGKQGGPRVAWTDSAVHLGVDHNESATDAVALASKVKEELDDLRTTVNNFIQTFGTHTHTVTTAGCPVSHTGTAAPTLSTVTQASPIGEVKSDVVKCK